MVELMVFVGGLVMLLIGGRVLVAGAVDIAQRLGLPTLLIGLTLVAWGTSAPELAFNLTSAIKGKPDLVMGNVVGASICNIGLVLGVSSLIAPLAVQAAIIRREIPLMVGMFLLMLAVSLYEPLQHALGGRLEHLILLGAFAGYSAYVIRAGLRSRHEDRAMQHQSAGAEIVGKVKPVWIACVMIVVGIVLLSVGGAVASDAAGAMAVKLGMTPRVVGLTVVSVGTTLPELITSIMAIRNKQSDLAVGNALGSCLFNVGAIFSICGLVAPALPPPGSIVSIATMCVMGIMLFPMVYTNDRRISRIEGAILLLTQITFIAYELTRAKG